MLDEYFAGAPTRMGAKRRTGAPVGSSQLEQERIMLLSSIGKERGMGASVVVEGSTNTKVFESGLQ